MTTKSASLQSEYSPAYILVGEVKGVASSKSSASPTARSLCLVTITNSSANPC